METKLKILAVIPARAGSKRLPKKNILPLNGKPLIQWTILAAQQATCLDRIVVSSDDPVTLKIAQECGVEYIQRPKELASDTAKSVDVINHAISFFAGRDEHFDAVMLLQPTSPLRASADIRAAVSLFTNKKAGSVVSMSLSEHSPLLTTRLNESASLQDFYPVLRSIPQRSQDMEQYYRLNGAIYIARTEQYLKTGTLFCDPGFAYIMPPERSVDIDSAVDFVTCQALIERSTG